MFTIAGNQNVKKTEEIPYSRSTFVENPEANII